jgi:hypothetical protein
MDDRAASSEQALSLEEIAKYHEDAVSSLKFYFDEAPPSIERFFDSTPQERVGELKKRIDETALRSILITLAALEASFRIDYEDRCRRRLKDSLSRALRDVYRQRGAKKTRLDEDIFEAWRNHIVESKRRIGDLRSAFKVRHWLAHGRYGERKPSASFDFDDYYDLAIVVHKEFFGDASVNQ